MRQLISNYQMSHFDMFRNMIIQLLYYKLISHNFLYIKTGVKICFFLNLLQCGINIFNYSRPTPVHNFSECVILSDRTSRKDNKILVLWGEPVNYKTRGDNVFFFPK